MTTEEKARKYDEAIERARKLKESPEEVFLEFSPNDGETVCDYIFPELSHKNKTDDVCVHQTEDFNEGDWVTDGNKNLYVSGKSDNAYVVLSENGTLSSIPFDSVQKFHRWSVKDAKVGDILVDNNDKLPFVLRRVTNNGELLPYCGIINKDGVFRFMDDWKAADCNGSFVDVSPANFEQRKMIYDAIEKAGYSVGTF